jgi:hypothetical protein
MPLPDVWGELLKNSVKAKFAFWPFSEVRPDLLTHWSDRRRSAS